MKDEKLNTVESLFLESDMLVLKNPAGWDTSKVTNISVLLPYKTSFDGKFTKWGFDKEKMNSITK